MTSFKPYQKLHRRTCHLCFPATAHPLSRNSSRPTAELPKRPEPPPTDPLSKGCDSTDHTHICNKLQEVHSSKLIAITPGHVTSSYKAAPRTPATKNNYSVYSVVTLRAAIFSEGGWGWGGRVKRESDDYTARSCPAGITHKQFRLTSGSACFILKKNKLIAGPTEGQSRLSGLEFHCHRKETTF